MAWPKGKPRPPGAGRKAGTPNKSTQDLMAKCEQFGLDVFSLMLTLAAESEDRVVKFNMLKEIAQYVYPKRKPVDIQLSELPDEVFEQEARRRLTLVKKAE